MNLYLPLPGSSFLVPTPIPSDPNKKHLFIFTAGPVTTDGYDPDSILLTSLRRVKGDHRIDKTSFFTANDNAHIFITEDSWIDYSMASITTLARLDAAVRKGTWVTKGPFSPVGLRRIQSGVLHSPRTDPDVASFFLICIK